MRIWRRLGLTNPQLEIEKALYKRGVVSFIGTREGQQHLKQIEALTILQDKTTTEFVYGGAAGGAKSWTGCAWLFMACLSYPGTKWFIGREDLKRIKKSTLITLGKVARKYGGGASEFKLNVQDSVIEFKNGSKIDLLNLQYMPSDPLYERFGSVEYTGGWIEEGGEIHFGAFDVLKTRIGRHLNDHYKLIPKLFITCNPKKNWLYTEYYKPFKENRLLPHQKFLQAFIQDNPFIESFYLEQLKSTKDKAKKERLLYGNWDYDDNPYALCMYENILAMFTNIHVQNLTAKWYLTADIARYGSDKARIGVWRGWELVEVVSFEISKTTKIQATINALRVKYRIPAHRCIADEDGVGGGVVDNCGILGFVNNARPLEEVISDEENDIPKYKNLQTQCLFKLADVINACELLVTAELSVTEKDEIQVEIGTIEQDPNQEYVLTLTKKVDIKEAIGRSPDWRDMFLMRAYFDLATMNREPQDLEGVF